MQGNNGNAGNGIELALSSGFKIKVKPLPPYYLDIIEEAIPLPEYPTRKIMLAAGDIADWPYEPKDEASDPQHEDYQLYIKWKSVDRERAVTESKRVKARKDFLLSTCVEIIDGPVDFDTDDWVDKVEAAFDDYEVPEHYGKRLLVFLKTQVINTAEEMEIVLKYALSQEVSMQGILRALQGFQYNLEKERPDKRHRRTTKRQN